MDHKGTEVQAGTGKSHYYLDRARWVSGCSASFKIFFLFVNKVKRKG
jgi:hypothetical protein